MKKETIESLRNEHRRLCDKKAELYKKGSLRGVAGINQNLELLRWKIEQKKEEQELVQGENLAPIKNSK